MRSDVSVNYQAPGFVLSTRVVLPRRPDELFSFFSDAFNLERITPPFLKFRVVSEAPLELRKGSEIDYRLRLHGLPIRWRTLIKDWNPPHGFIDEQLEGPYRRWIHEHSFAPHPNGTLARDRVYYEVLGGRLVNAVIVERDVRRIFEFRRGCLLRLFALVSD